MQGQGRGGRRQKQRRPGQIQEAGDYCKEAGGSGADGEDNSVECGVLVTVLWNVGQCGQFCGMLSCGDSLVEC